MATGLRWGLSLGWGLSLALAGAALVAPAATAADGGHGFGRMGPGAARTTTVSPSGGPDFEMPFLCGQQWTGSTRSSHSPSVWTIDWNSPDDLGKPALASAPGIVTRAVTLTGGYGRYVVVDHGRGYSTLYAHLNQIVAAVGQVVDQGDLIGYVGGSGNVTGPHLHHEERLNGSYFRPYLHRTTWGFGTTRPSASCNDRPFAGDFDGDGKADVGIFRAKAGTSAFYERTASATRILNWGSAADVPVAGDFDGDGASQVGVRRMAGGTWWLRGASGARATVTGVSAASDFPVTGDWDGNGRDGLGFYRWSTHTFYLRSDSGALAAVRWGTTGDQPVTGDWNGDGRTDVGVFNPSTRTWWLRVPSGGTVVTQRVVYGAVGDNIPVTGDWDGDGRTDLGVWRPSLGRFHVRTVKPGTTQVVSSYRVFGLRRG